MPTDMAIVTVVTRDYLSFARAMVESVRAVHPELPVFICMADRPSVPFDPAKEQATIFFADELNIPRWHRFAFQYDGFELSCALKPFAIEHVRSKGFTRVAYLDADILVYSRLDDLLAPLSDQRMVLTPHLVHPLPDDGCLPDELTIARAGVVNGGFVGLNGERDQGAFLNWWKFHCSRDCVVDQHAGLFVDQRWLDLAVAMFDGVFINRGQQYNVAYWNLPHRTIARDAEGQWLIGDQRLAFYHFSGWRAEEPDNLSRYQNRVKLTDHLLLLELLRDYRSRLDRHAWEACRQWGSTHSNLDCGLPIDPTWREVIRLNHPALADVENPFAIVESSSEMIRLKAAGVDMIPRRVSWQLNAFQDRLNHIEEHPFRWLFRKLLGRNKR
ncbi:MAG: hypothetical protein WD768_09415 [Phycisphaeraceae bacterium]